MIRCCGRVWIHDRAPIITSLAKDRLVNPQGPHQKTKFPKVWEARARQFGGVATMARPSSLLFLATMVDDAPIQNR